MNVIYTCSRAKWERCPVRAPFFMLLTDEQSIKCEKSLFLSFTIKKLKKK